MSRRSKAPRASHPLAAGPSQPAGPPVIRVYLVRHGETNENRAGIIQGQLDTQLNADGVQQAALCAERLKDVHFLAAFTSDLQRTLKTAEIILQPHPNIKLNTEMWLRERDMGSLQGVRAGSYDKSKMPPDVESGEDFARRTLEWWEGCIVRSLPRLPATSSPFNVLAVSHGAYIATLVRTLVAAKVITPAPGVRFGSVYNTSVTIIDVRRDEQGTLVMYSDIAHLVAPAVAHNADEQPQG